MIWTIIIILFVLWLLGYFGSSINPRFPRSGSWIHTLIVIILILIILEIIGLV